MAFTKEQWDAIKVDDNQPAVQATPLGATAGDAGTEVVATTQNLNPQAGPLQAQLSAIPREALHQAKSGAAGFQLGLHQGVENLGNMLMSPEVLLPGVKPQDRLTFQDVMPGRTAAEEQVLLEKAHLTESPLFSGGQIVGGTIPYALAALAAPGEAVGAAAEGLAARLMPRALPMIKSVGGALANTVGDIAGNAGKTIASRAPQMFQQPIETVLRVGAQALPTTIPLAVGTNVGNQFGETRQVNPAQAITEGVPEGIGQAGAVGGMAAGGQALVGAVKKMFEALGRVNKQAYGPPVPKGGPSQQGVGSRLLEDAKKGSALPTKQMGTIGPVHGAKLRELQNLDDKIAYLSSIGQEESGAPSVYHDAAQKMIQELDKRAEVAAQKTAQLSGKAEVKQQGQLPTDLTAKVGQIQDPQQRIDELVNFVLQGNEHFRDAATKQVDNILKSMGAAAQIQPMQLVQKLQQLGADATHADEATAMIESMMELPQSYQKLILPVIVQKMAKIGSQARDLAEAATAMAESRALIEQAKAAGGKASKATKKSVSTDEALSIIEQIRNADEKALDRFANASNEELAGLSKEQRAERAQAITVRRADLAKKEPGAGGAPDNKAQSDSPLGEKPTLGDFRKKFVEGTGSRRERYKQGAVAEVVAEANGLTPQEAADLKDMTQIAAYLAVKMREAVLQRSELSDWALQNEATWNPTKKSGWKFTVEALEKLGQETLDKATKVYEYVVSHNFEANLTLPERFELELERWNLLNEAWSKGKLNVIEKNSKSTINTTVNGVVSKSPKVQSNGKYKIKEVPQELPFEKAPRPNNIDELVDTLEKLDKQVDAYREQLRNLYSGGVGYEEFEGGFRALGDKMFEMQKAQLEKKLPGLSAEEIQKQLPALHINTTIEHNGKPVIVSLRYDQPKNIWEFGDTEVGKAFGALYKALEAQVKAIAEAEFIAGDKKRGKVTLNTYKNSANDSKKLLAIPDPTLGFLTGIAFMAHKLAKEFTSKGVIPALHTMTNYGVVKSRREWGGHLLVQRINRIVHETFGDIARNPKQFAKILGSQHLSVMLTKTKGLTGAQIQEKLIDTKILTPEEVNVATVVRSQWKRIAKMLESYDNALEQILLDVKNGHPDLKAEHQFDYQPEHYDKNGNLRKDLYDRVFHQAIKDLKRRFDLQGENLEIYDQAWRDLGSMLSVAYFTNSVKAFFRNIFDPIPTIVGEVGLIRFWQAQMQAMTDKKVRDFVGRLGFTGAPNWALIERLFNESEGRFQKSQRKVASFGPLGKIENIMSYPDRFYSQGVALAAVRKVGNQAIKEGRYSGSLKEFVHEYVDGTLNNQLDDEVGDLMANNITELLNSWIPTQNVDPVAMSWWGRIFATYSAGPRRAANKMLGWLAEGTPSGLRKFLYATAWYTMIGAPIPSSVFSALSFFSPQIAVSIKKQIARYNMLHAGSPLMNALGVDKDHGLYLDEYVNYDVLNFGTGAFGIEQLGDLTSQWRKAINEKDRAAMIRSGVATGFMAYPAIAGIPTSQIWSVIKNDADVKARSRVLWIKEPGGVGAKEVTVPWDASDGVFNAMLGNIGKKDWDARMRIYENWARRVELFRGIRAQIKRPFKTRPDVFDEMIVLLDDTLKYLMNEFGMLGDEAETQEPENTTNDEQPSDGRKVTRM